MFPWEGPEEQNYSPLGLLFCAAFLASPFVGFGLGRFVAGEVGAAWGTIVGMSLTAPFAAWAVFIHPRRSKRCERCRRAFRILGLRSPTGFDIGAGVLFRTSDVQLGLEGPGDQCLQCQRVFCSNCAQVGMVCVCGGRRFRMVRLRY